MNKLSKVKDEFNPRFDAKSRVYKYFILNNSKELPFSKDYVYYIQRNFELEQLNNISKIFLGEKNFQNFSKLRINVSLFDCDRLLHRITLITGLIK